MRPNDFPPARPDMPCCDPKNRRPIYRAGPHVRWDYNPYGILIEEKVVTGGDTFAVHVAAPGGVAVRFTSVK